MINSSVKITSNFNAKKIISNVNFATAKALTATAKDAQSSILKSIDANFTVRGKWSQPSNKFGVKVKPATKSNLRAEVGTNADWLEPHERGGTKTPKGENLAIPTENVRRTKRQLIQRSQRPGALRGKRDVVLPLKSGKGKALFVRKFKGKRSQLVKLYNLEPTARIRKQSTVLEPTEKVFKRRFNHHFQAAFRQAIATAK